MNLLIAIFAGCLGYLAFACVVCRRLRSNSRRYTKTPRGTR
jgi:hypothetical protein